MKLTLLASGSKGGCCLIKYKDTKLIIDYGTACKYLKSCSEQIGYDPIQSNALLITHTYSDHIVQMKLFDLIPTYVTQDIATSHLHAVRPCDHFGLQDFRITVLPMSHDCEGTVGYVIETEDEKVVYVADTGYTGDEVEEYIHNVDYCVFKSNHDIKMLVQTTRPVYLKQHIIGNCGHLYNEDYSNILHDVVGDHTREIVLAHIPQEGNIRGIAPTTPKETLKRK